MDSAVTIRPAGAEDILTIGVLANQIWPDTYGHILSAVQLQYMLQLIYSPASLTKQMSELHHQFLMLELEKLPVGFASFSATAEPGVYKLQKIYVRTDIQGKGLGKALIDAVIASIKPLQATALRLNVNRHNKAISFYEKFGFAIIGEEDIDIGNGYFMNDYVMEKVLGS
ncbi:MAG: GNAT family N-acetyltransferase [Chitinophagaceae bacterium]